ALRLGYNRRGFRGFWATMDEDSGEVRPADGALPSAALPPPPRTDAAPTIEPPATDPAVGNPSPPAGEGDRHKAVEGAATPAVPEAEPTSASAPAPIPVPAPSRPPLSVPPLLEFAAWRLLELVATVLAASLLVGLVLPADA